MTRDDTKPRTLFRCTEAFAVFTNGVPDVFAEGREVLDGDPILKTHRAHFEDATSRVMRSREVEKATAAPGELRAVSTSHQIASSEGAHRG